MTGRSFGFLRALCFFVVLFIALNQRASAQCTSSTYTVCLGSSITITSSCTPATAWGSSPAGVASVTSSTSSSASVLGVAVGSTTITFSASGFPRSTSITVNPLPNAGTITGPSAVCVGSHVTLSSSVAGGSWTSSATGIATVSTSGVVTGVASGTATMTYTVTTACGTNAATYTVAVDATTYPASISGSTSSTVCEPGSLSPSIASGVPAGVTARWSCSTGSGNIDSITGYFVPYTICNATGSGTITLSFRNSCGTTTDSRPITIRPENRMTDFVSLMCPGSSYLFTNCGIGGTWNSSDISVATVSASGVVTAIASGTASISYTNTNICLGTSVTRSVSVTVGAPTSLSLASTICSGGVNAVTATISPAYEGGTWSSSAPGIASVTTPTSIAPNATVTGYSGGTAIISYSCGSVYVGTASITINVSPSVADIGPGSGVYLCTGTTYTLTETTTGGTWSSSNNSLATVTSGGVVTGVSPGYPTITYSKTVGSCTSYKTNTVTVFGAPNPGVISGPVTVCVGANITLIDTFHHSSGAWSCSPLSVATIDPATHKLYGITAGTVTVSYTLTDAFGYCPSASAYYTVTVEAPPGAFTGITSFCYSSGTLLSNAVSGGAWTCSDLSVASVDPSSGAVTPTVPSLIPQTATIYYSISNSCGTNAASTTITIYPNPTITGPFSVCEGATTTMAANISGGTWASSNVSVATINPVTGFLTALSAGTTTINYSVPGGATACGDVALFTVNPNPVISVGVGTAPPTTFPAVDCGSGVLLTAYSSIGLTTFTWLPPTGLYFPGTSTPVAGLPATTVLCFGLSSTVTYSITGVSPLGCAGHATTTVTQPSCDYSFCQAFSGAPIYALAGTIGTIGATTVMPAGNYNVQANVLFQGNVQFSNNVLAIAPAVTMSVSPTAKLDVSASHLYCCDRIQLWGGIILQNGLTSSGRMTVGGNSLIEDAETAISIPSGFVPASGTVFTSDGTVFNKNKNACIDISIFPNPASSFIPSTYPFTYPFLIRNSVFTSRDLSVIAPTGSGPTHAWPMVWPATTGTSNGLKTAYTPTTTYPAFSPPFNIASPNGSGITGIRYPYSDCNNGTLANMGIKLLNVGDYHSTGLNQPATYAGIVIGDNSFSPGNPGQNLFDTLLEGIYARNSNFTCYNGAFLYMHTKPAGYFAGNLTGDGIGAQCAATGVTGTTVYPKYSMTVTGNSGSSSATNNVFYNNERGVVSYYYYNVDCHNSFIINYPGTLPSGQFGFNVNSPRYHDINITGNTLTNTATGINMTSSLIGGDINQFAGNLSIRNNIVQSNIGGAIPATGMAVTNAIMATNAVFAGSPPNTFWLGTAHLDNNTMYNVYNGIGVVGYHIGQTITSDTNYVRINNRPTSAAQYGIQHLNCNASSIFNNYITGPGYNVPGVSIIYSSTGAPMSVNKITGIYGGANINTSVTCNYTGHMNVGFQFLGTGNIHHWLNNEMDDNSYGLVMKGDFGAQGTASAPSNNVWKNTPLWWNAPNYNIYTLNLFSPATASSIFLSSNITATDPYIFDPLNNRNNPVPVFFTYGFGAGSGNGLNIISANPEMPACLTLPPTYFAKPVTLATGPFDEGMAQNFIGQYSLWQMIQNDASYTDGEPALQVFATKAASSRFGWLSNIANAISSGNKSQAASLLATDIHAYVDTSYDTASHVLMRDGVDADYIIANYLTFYTISMKYLDTAMNGNDSEQLNTIANLCPYTNGSVVYLAQALCRALNGDRNLEFNANCETDNHSKATPVLPQEDNSVRLFSLYPNPNNSTFKIRQNIPDKSPVDISIADMLGREVYHKENCIFEDDNIDITSRFSEGVYVLKIKSCKNKDINIIFVVR